MMRRLPDLRIVGQSRGDFFATYLSCVELIHVESKYRATIARFFSSKPGTGPCDPGDPYAERFLVQEVVLAASEQVAQDVPYRVVVPFHLNLEPGCRMSWTTEPPIALDVAVYGAGVTP